MTSNNDTGKTPSTWRVRDEVGDEIVVNASTQHVYLETPHELFEFDMQATHKLACVLLLAAEQVMGAGGEQQ